MRRSLDSDIEAEMPDAIESASREDPQLISRGVSVFPKEIRSARPSHLAPSRRPGRGTMAWRLQGRRAATHREAKAPRAEAQRQASCQVACQRGFKSSRTLTWCYAFVAYYK